jgi:L-ascorbate metabolism protein UlaG (beta-lactamase superfamily)
MTITWHGQYTIKIQTNVTTIIIDPYSPDCGLPLIRSKANIVALSNPASASMSHIKSVQGEPYIIDTPGEYAPQGATLHAMSWYTSEGVERNVQRWHIEGFVLLHVGALNRPLNNDELQELEKTDIDILFLPVGNKESLTVKQAVELLTTIEPRIVIPIHFKIPKLREELESVEPFANEVGAEKSQREKKLTLKSRKKLPEKELATIILMP